MNERIKELAEQARIEVNGVEGIAGPLYNQKFAELIIKECTRACGSVQEQFFNGRIATDDFNLKNRFAEAETACDMVQTKIEMTFGVE